MSETISESKNHMSDKKSRSKMNMNHNLKTEDKTSSRGSSRARRKFSGDILHNQHSFEMGRPNPRLSEYDLSLIHI